MPAKDLSQFAISGTLMECSSRQMGNSGKYVTDIVVEVIDSWVKDGQDVEMTKPVPLQIGTFTMSTEEAARLPIGGKILLAGRVGGYSKESNGRTFHNVSLDVQSITILQERESNAAAEPEEAAPF